jgi:hypothetical protein
LAIARGNPQQLYVFSEALNMKEIGESTKSCGQGFALFQNIKQNGDSSALIPEFEHSAWKGRRIRLGILDTK